MSQDITGTRIHVLVGPGVFFVWYPIGGVDDILVQDIAGVGDDGGVAAVDQADDFGTGVAAADAEMGETAGVAQADSAVGADDVVTDLPETQ